MRVFDTFLFDGEFDLLEHRLRETFDLVDVFVLVEAAETFRGQPKPLLFRENRARFAWAASKIRPLALSRLSGASPWDREAFQRDAILLALRDAAPEDIVMILDADEIMSRDALTRLHADGLDRPHRPAFTRHYEAVNLVAPASACCPASDAPFPFHLRRAPAPAWPKLDPRWWERSGVVVRYKDLVGDAARVLPPRSAYDLRRLTHAAPTLPDAGRHFVSTDPSARLVRKLARVSHDELADDRSLSPPHLARTRAHGVHHHGWWYAALPPGPLPDDLERLATRCPSTLRRASLPARPLRALVRTWAWLRFWPLLGDRLVGYVDRHFEPLVPLLAAPLFTMALLRRMAARFRWQPFAKLSTGAREHGHKAG